MSTPIRNLRVPDHEWDAWKQRARAEDMTLTRWLRTLANREIAGGPFSPPLAPTAGQIDRLAAARTVEPRFKA